MDDIFQERYLKHQETKLNKYTGGFKLSPRGSLIYYHHLLNVRSSQRFFNNKAIQGDELNYILNAIALTPSSCNRQAVYVKKTTPKYAEKTLVGAKKWADKSNMVLLLFADKLAYKSPNEKAFMPYLDIGACIQSVYLMCEALNIGCCFVNPNIREEDKPAFIEEFGDDYFGGAFVLGKYDNKAPVKSKRLVSEVLR